MLDCGLDTGLLDFDLEIDVLDCDLEIVVLDLGLDIGVLDWNLDIGVLDIDLEIDVFDCDLEISVFDSHLVSPVLLPLKRRALRSQCISPYITHSFIQKKTLIPSETTDNSNNRVVFKSMKRQDL